MKPTKTLAYSYLRFSSPEQAKGDSLRRQTALRDAWLSRNKVNLDTALTLEDKGVSGYTGEHRGNPDRHALAAFVELVKAGRIAQGSYLIVENLDRLSREDIIPALSLLLNLIQGGVRVVQLLPAEAVYDSQSNPMTLMMAIMELSRGHSESAMKSERVGAAWQAKKRKAAEDGTPLTARVPAWLRLVDGSWEVDEAAAESVRRIYRMATDGHGLGVITKRLNAEGVPIVGRGRHWARSYVAKLLGNRAAVGEYQPHTGRGVKRRMDGKPIADYYPAIIAETDWYAARAALTSRRGKPGRLSKDRVNIFAGLLHDARDGGKLHQVNKGKKGGGVLLASYKAAQGVDGAKWASFPLATFEAAVLSCLQEIDPREVLPRKEKGADKVMVTAGRLAEVEAEIEKVKARLQTRYSEAIADVLVRHETERGKLVEQLTQARQEASTPLSDAWGECRSLVDALDAAPDAEDARIRLRAALRRITENVWSLFIVRGKWRIAAVQLWFTGGAHRDYLILHRAANGGSVAVRPSQWWCRSLASAAPGKLDLRKPGHAVRLDLTTADRDK
jgi:DNA invertase Pin-like site-specific DNA recombinase